MLDGKPSPMDRRRDRPAQRAPARSPSAIPTTASRSKAKSAACGSTIARCSPPMPKPWRCMSRSAFILTRGGDKRSQATRSSGCSIISSPTMPPPICAASMRNSTTLKERLAEVKKEIVNVQVMAEMAQAARHLHPGARRLSQPRRKGHTRRARALSAAAQGRARRTVSAWRSGCSARSIRSPRASPSIATGSSISESAWSRPRKISARRATLPSSATCSTGSPSSSRRAGTSRPCSV